MWKVGAILDKLYQSIQCKNYEAIRKTYQCIQKSNFTKKEKEIWIIYAYPKNEYLKKVITTLCSQVIP